MLELNKENNDLPTYSNFEEFDVTVYHLILEHCVDNNITEIQILPDNKISAVFEDQSFNLNDRNIFNFEISMIIQRILPQDDFDLLKDAGQIDTTEYIEHANGRKTAYNRKMSLLNDNTFSIQIAFLKDAVIPESEIEESLTENEFAGQHDGATFPIVGVLTDETFDDLLRWAGDRKASDITITPDQHVMADIGGKLCKITDRVITSTEIENCVRYVYGENGTAEVLAGHDLDPSHEVRVKGQRIRRYRVNVSGGRIPGGMGMQMTIRTLPSSPIPIEKLNVEPSLLEATRPTNGIVFVCGPTGSGKSTLMSSIIRMIVERPDANEKVLEYSSPIEYVFDDVEMPSSTIFQTHVGRHLRPREKGTSEWAYAARNSLRRKPTIIVLGEARDAETIEEAVKISQEGHLTYSTMHTNSVAETINRAINVFPHIARDRMSIDLMGALRMVVVQILVPRIGGGKIACREYMVFDPKTREKFLKSNQTTWPVLIQRMLAEQQVSGQTMLKSALKLLSDGEISVESFEKIAEAGGTS